MYEHPEVEFADTKEKFSDIRKRAFTFPGLGEKARLVAVPTPSGAGSEVTADSGSDALTHATEACVSVYANDYTDGLCLPAIKLIFENLERCVVDGAFAPEAREKTHNASTVACRCSRRRSG